MIESNRSINRQSQAGAPTLQTIMLTDSEEVTRFQAEDDVVFRDRGLLDRRGRKVILPDDFAVFGENRS